MAAGFSWFSKHIPKPFLMYVESNLSVALKTFCNAGKYSKQIYEQEMQHGFIELTIGKVVLFGIAGSGKTCSLAALLGDPPPDIRRSTPLMQRPVQVMLIITDGEMQWKKMTAGGIRQNIAQIIRSRAAYRVESRSSTSNDRQQQFSTKVNQSHSSTDETVNISISEAATTFLATSGISASRATTIPPEEKLPSTAQFTSEVTLDSLLESSDFDKEYVSLINNSAPSDKPILQQSWLYVIDSGGQHEFHEVLPIFLNGASDFIFVFEIHESLDTRPQIAFYDSSGRLVCEPCPSFLTNEEIFKQCMLTMCSFTSKNQNNTPPQIIVLGTHRDMVKEEDMPQVLETLKK